MIRVYGSLLSRARIVMAVLEQLELDYELVEVPTLGPKSRSPEYRALNPTGKVPTLVDGDLVLWETQAILFYLARKYGENKLWVDDIATEADLYRWSLFVSNQIEAPALEMMLAVRLAKEDGADQAVIDKAASVVQRHLPVLESHLQDHPYLAGNKLTVADFHGAAVLSWPKLAGFDYTPYPAIARWLTAVLGLPAQKAIQRWQNN
ncbi:MAG: glutathione S-transferase family protein [Amphritea sp.]|nr:glutathione S-transferase family protein [Amphritea sp.]